VFESNNLLKNDKAALPKPAMNLIVCASQYITAMHSAKVCELGATRSSPGLQ
jgi:hypothetical protein